MALRSSTAGNVIANAASTGICAERAGAQASVPFPATADGAGRPRAAAQGGRRPGRSNCEEHAGVCFEGDGSWREDERSI